MPENTHDLSDLSRERLGLLLEHIQDLPPEGPQLFDMKDFMRGGAAPVEEGEHHLCGTSACLAGHAAFMFDKEVRDYLLGKTVNVVFSYERKGLDTLDLPNRADSLFYSCFWPEGLQEGRLEDAVVVLSGLLDGSIVFRDCVGEDGAPYLDSSYGIFRVDDAPTETETEGGA